MTKLKEMDEMEIDNNNLSDDSIDFEMIDVNEVSQNHS